MAGAAVPFQDVPEVGRRFQLHFVLMVDRFDTRHEKRVDTGQFAYLSVRLFPSRIFVEILAREKLGRIDEDRDDDMVVFGARLPNQGQMPLMERSHRRHETDASRHLLPGRLHLFDISDNLHRQPFGYNCDLKQYFLTINYNKDSVWTVTNFPNL